MKAQVRYTESEARAAIACSLTFTEALRHLGMRTAGRNLDTLRHWARVWGIPTDHFDSVAGRARSNRRVGRERRRPLVEVLVEGSTYSRHSLKQRLYEEGLKVRACEMCGQGETWRGRTMSLILDHINGVSDDNRLENLRIVCPNCAATLETHCGKNKAIRLPDRDCLHCSQQFSPYGPQQRYCCVKCSYAHREGVPQLERRRVERPPFQELMALVAADGYLATGRRFGVSDNAIRKWVRQYEREAGTTDGPDLRRAA